MRLSGVVEVVGLLLALYGLGRTWVDFRPPGERFLEFGPLVRAVEPVRRRVVALGRTVAQKVLGRHPNQIVGVGTIIQGGGAMNARVRAQFRVIPEEINPKTAIAELDGRTRQLMDTASDTKEALADEVERAEQREADLARRLEEAVSRLDLLSRHVAVDGIRLEAIGLLLVGVGLVLRSFGY